MIEQAFFFKQEGIETSKHCMNPAKKRKEKREKEGEKVSCQENCTVGSRCTFQGRNSWYL